MSLLRVLYSQTRTTELNNEFTCLFYVNDGLFKYHPITCPANALYSHYIAVNIFMWLVFQTKFISKVLLTVSLTVRNTFTITVRCLERGTNEICSKIETDNYVGS